MKKPHLVFSASIAPDHFLPHTRFTFQRSQQRGPIHFCNDIGTECHQMHHISALRDFKYYIQCSKSVRVETSAPKGHKREVFCETLNRKFMTE